MGEMVGLNAPTNCLGFPRLAVLEFDLVLSKGRTGERVEHRQIGLAQSDILEGDRLEFVCRRKRNPVLESTGELFERGLQLAVKGRAAILLQGFAGDEER